MPACLLARLGNFWLAERELLQLEAGCERRPSVRESDNSFMAERRVRGAGVPACGGAQSAHRRRRGTRGGRAHACVLLFRPTAAQRCAPGAAHAARPSHPCAPAGVRIAGRRRAYWPKRRVLCAAAVAAIRAAEHGRGGNRSRFKCSHAPGPHDRWPLAAGPPAARRETGSRALGTGRPGTCCWRLVPLFARLWRSGDLAVTLWRVGRLAGVQLAAWLALTSLAPECGVRSAECVQASTSVAVARCATKEGWRVSQITTAGSWVVRRVGFE